MWFLSNINENLIRFAADPANLEIIKRQGKEQLESWTAWKTRELESIFRTNREMTMYYFEYQERECFTRKLGLPNLAWYLEYIQDNSTSSREYLEENIPEIFEIAWEHIVSGEERAAARCEQAINDSIEHFSDPEIYRIAEICGAEIIKPYEVHTREKNYVRYIFLIDEILKFVNLELVKLDSKFNLYGLQIMKSELEKLKAKCEVEL